MNISNTIFCSHRYHISVRYSSLQTPQNVSLSIVYENDTVSFPLHSEDIYLEANSNHILTNKSIMLMSSGNYTIKIESENLLIDSLVILPTYKNNEIYIKASDHIKNFIKMCWEEELDIKEKNLACRHVVFSSTVELFNGTLGIDTKS